MRSLVFLVAMSVFGSILVKAAEEPISPNTARFIFNDDTKHSKNDGSHARITLEDDNHVIVQGIIEGYSAGRVASRLLTLDKEESNDPIFLVLDTPGGIVLSGMDIVSVLKVMRRPVHVVIINAMSMGFILAQSTPHKRYILPKAVMMTHSAKLSVPEDELPLKLKKFFDAFEDLNRYIKTFVADRLGLSLDKYEEMEKNETFAGAYSAISQNMADEMVLLVCGASVELANCPLIPGYVSLDAAPTNPFGF